MANLGLLWLQKKPSAAGYLEPNKSSEFRYIPDGMLVQVLTKRTALPR